MKAIIDKIKEKSYVDIEDLIRISERVPWLFPMSEVQKTKLRAVVNLLQVEYDNRFDIKINMLPRSSYTKRIYLDIEIIIKYEEVTITSTDEHSHTTKDLYVVHKLSFSDNERLLLGDGIRVFSTHFTLPEIKRSYVHSHINNDFCDDVKGFIRARSSTDTEVIDMYSNSTYLCLGTSQLTSVMSQLYEQNDSDFLYYFNYVDYFLTKENLKGAYGMARLRDLVVVTESCNNKKKYSKIETFNYGLSDNKKRMLDLQLKYLISKLTKAHFTGTRFEVSLNDDIEYYLMVAMDASILKNTIDNCYYKKQTVTDQDLSQEKSLIKKYDNKGYLGFYFRNEWVPIILIDESVEEDVDDDNYKTVLQPVVAKYVINLLNETINRQYYEFQCQKTCI